MVHPLPLQTLDCTCSPPRPSFLPSSSSSPRKRTSAPPAPPGTSDRMDKCCIRPRPVRSTPDRTCSPPAPPLPAERRKTKDRLSSHRWSTTYLHRTGCKALLPLPRTPHRRCTPLSPSSPKVRSSSPHTRSSSPPAPQDTTRSPDTPSTLPRLDRSSLHCTCSPLQPSFPFLMTRTPGTLSTRPLSSIHRLGTTGTGLPPPPRTPHRRCSLPPNHSLPGHSHFQRSR
jgi:hypothetical protein